jgi:cell division protein FtsB
MQRKSAIPNRPRGNNQARTPRVNGARILKILAIVLVVLDLGLLYALFLSARGVRAYRAQHAEVQRLAQERTRLALENQRLIKKIRHFKENPGARERLVKQELGWVREDEIIIEFATPEPAREFAPVL